MPEEIQHEGPQSAQCADLPRSAMISIKNLKGLSSYSAFLACDCVCAVMGTQMFGRRNSIVRPGDGKSADMHEDTQH
jgi:hypothetical protein